MDEKTIADIQFWPWHTWGVLICQLLIAWITSSSCGSAIYLSLGTMRRAPSIVEEKVGDELQISKPMRFKVSASLLYYGQILSTTTQFQESSLIRSAAVCSMYSIQNLFVNTIYFWSIDFTIITPIQWTRGMTYLCTTSIFQNDDAILYGVGYAHTNIFTLNSIVLEYGYMFRIHIDIRIQGMWPASLHGFGEAHKESWANHNGQPGEGGGNLWEPRPSSHDGTGFGDKFRACPWVHICVHGDEPPASTQRRW